MLETFSPIIHTKLFWIPSLILVIIYAYFKFIIYSYWKRKEIPHDEPKIPFGITLPVVLGKASLGNKIIFKFCNN